MELYKEIVLSLLGILVIFGLGYWRGRRRRQALAENAGEGAVRRWLTKGLAADAVPPDEQRDAAF